MKTNDEIKKMAREVVNQMHDAEITKPPHVVITYTELNDLVGQICQVKDADRERAVEEERESWFKKIDQLRQKKMSDNKDITDGWDMALLNLRSMNDLVGHTPNISNNK